MCNTKALYQWPWWTIFMSSAFRHQFPYVGRHRSCLSICWTRWILTMQYHDLFSFIWWFSWIFYWMKTVSSLYYLYLRKNSVIKWIAEFSEEHWSLLLMIKYGVFETTCYCQSIRLNLKSTHERIGKVPEGWETRAPCNSIRNTSSV